MRKKSTRLLSAALAVCMTVTVLPMSAFASGEEELKSDVSPQKTTAEQSEETGGVTGDVVIDGDNFPDPIFCEFVKKYDINHDNALSQNERARVTEMDLNPSTLQDKEISTLKGIEHFTSLTKLGCWDIGLSELDVSQNSKLTELTCGDNYELSALNVGKKSKLWLLRCHNNALSELDVHECTALKELVCHDNDLSKLNVSQNKELGWLDCYGNDLSKLDVGENSKLHYLSCSSNDLSKLDVSKNSALDHLYCSENQLTSLDINGYNIEDEYFSCRDNSYDIAVDENNCYDLINLPGGKFDANKVKNPQGGSFDPVSNRLTVNENATEVTYTYDCGKNADGEKITAEFKLKVTRDQQEPAVPDAPAGGSGTDNIQGAISAVVVGAAAGAIIYEAGTGIYRVINMPGIPMPSNRIELAKLLWEHAGKPEPVSTALYSDIDEGDTDAQKAARWAVEQDLMKDNSEKNTFNPYFPVSKLRTCLTWNAAKEKGLFAKTEE